MPTSYNKMKKSITLASKIENIRFVENLVDEISEECEINELLYGNIIVSIVEAVNNAMKHGNKFDQTKHIKVECYISNKQLNFKICDQGKGFDYKNVPDPTKKENIDKPHGRGIFLINKLADKVKFYKNGREIIITFKL